MREHRVIGQEMLERRTELLAIGPLVRATHERWDGLGYPGRPARTGDPAARPGSSPCATRSTP